MPIVISYELKDATTTDHNRVQSFFERLGWENLGGSSYRYPKLGSAQRTEDWFNQVIPALMLFRAFILSGRVKLKKFTLDAQSSTGCNPQTKFGRRPISASSPRFELNSSNSAFGEKKLRQWIDSVVFPY